jgi:hypothetical protein
VIQKREPLEMTGVGKVNVEVFCVTQIHFENAYQNKLREIK